MLNVWKYGHLWENVTWIGYLCEICSMCENMAICVEIWFSLDICVKYAQCVKISKISGSALSFATLSKFLSPRSLSLFIHPRNHRATRRHLSSSIPTQEHALPQPRPWSAPPPSSSSSRPCTALGHCRATTIDLDPTSHWVRRHRQPWPTSLGCATAVPFLKPYTQPLTKVTPLPSLITYVVWMWMKYGCVCRIWVNLTELSWSHYWF
jgi:hypothetical protein